MPNWVFNSMVIEEIKGKPFVSGNQGIQSKRLRDLVDKITAPHELAKAREGEFTFLNLIEPDPSIVLHEHEGKPAQGFGLVWKGRLICYYDYECDLGDGWESPEIHNDSEETRTKALKMGANLLSYCFTNWEKK